MASWLIYALGGGFGHLTRACALARAALPQSVRILTNSPYAEYVRGAMPELELIALDPSMPVAQARVEVVHQIESAAPDCLIVDTFPRGLVGELGDISSLPGRKVLVQRDLNPAYAAAFDLNTFVRNSYDLVVVPGDESADGLGPFPQTVLTAPWLVRSRHEILTRDRARALLGLREARPCVVVCAAGNSEELDWYGAVVSGLLHQVPECDVRCIAPVCPKGCLTEYWVSRWPAMDLYGAADVVIGGAGYNTIYECVACEVPLVARPWPRKYDRQELRARRAALRGVVKVVEEPQEAVAAACEMVTSAHERNFEFHNGAPAAVASILQCKRYHRL